ncbi:hypothetical protein PR202_gb10839 [Eleusine coracana subsp. coracana]|uniref:Uncharacterized protein n=1 Tax=Eleusine coracana subsp. coracana TaxID=191504 RepID=A0AAV5EL06_ELECO|nr:hypothetical protein PR202_gb10839 [Eleusine coracana subsp. coracana]
MAAPTPDRAALTVGPGMDMPIMHNSDRYELVRDISCGNFGVALPNAFFCFFYTIFNIFFLIDPDGSQNHKERSLSLSWSASDISNSSRRASELVAPIREERSWK